MLISLCSSIFLLTSLPLKVVIVKGNQQILYPIADSQIDEFYPNLNHGWEDDIDVRLHPPYNTHRGLLKFNVTALPSSASGFRVRVYPWTQFGEPLVLWSINDDSWIEYGTGGVTWNNQPAHISLLDTSSLGADNWLEFSSSALDTFIQNQIDGDGIASFKILALTEEGECFWSREFGGTAYDPRLEVELPTAPFGEGWSPPFSGFHNDSSNPYDSASTYLIDSATTVRVNHPFQHSLLWGWNDVLMAFYIKQHNGTHWALGYRWSSDNSTWSSFVPILFVQTDNYHRSKYDVYGYGISNATHSFEGYFVAALGNYNASLDVAGSHEVYFLMGNITDPSTTTISWQSTLVYNGTEYFYNPVIDSAFSPIAGNDFYGLVMASLYYSGNWHVRSWRSTDANLEGWNAYDTEALSRFPYPSGTWAWNASAEMQAILYANNVTQPQYVWGDPAYQSWTEWANITDTASAGLDFQATRDFPLYYFVNSTEYGLADFTWFTFVRNSDNTLWFKLENLTALVQSFGDGGWVNETQVTSMTGLQSPQIILVPTGPPTDSGYQTHYVFAWAKSNAVYIRTLKQTVTTSLNRWAWAPSEQQVYTHSSLDESSLHGIEGGGPFFSFILTGSGLYAGALILEPVSEPPQPPPPPPIYVSDAYNVTLYFRSDTHTIHEVLGYVMATTNTRSEVIDERLSAATESVSYGVRVWAVDAFDNQYELTNGEPEAVITVSSPSTGMRSGTWLCPAYNYVIDAILVKVYQRFGSDPWNLRRIFITDDHLLWKLPSSTWTFYLWIGMSQGSTTSQFGFGDYDVYNSRVNLQYYRASPWEIAFSRLYEWDFLGFMFTPWTYGLGDMFWTILLFFLCVSAYLRFNSWKPVLALLWILGGTGSILWALVPALSLHVAVLMLALAMAVTLYKLVR